MPWLLAAAGLALGIWGFTDLNDGTSAREAIYHSIQLVGLEDAATGEGGWQLDVARFILPIAAIWLTAEAFTRLFVIFRDDRLGTLRARGHVVICGYGRTGQAIIEGVGDRRRKVVLIRREAVAALRENIPVVRGDAREPRVLRQARISHADEIWVACGDDNINAEVATQIAAMLAGKQRPPTVHFGIREPRLHRALVVPDPLLPFDLNAVTAQKMVATMAADHEAVATMAAGDQAVAIAGFGKLGQAVAAQLGKTPGPKIVAWDRRAKHKAAEMWRRDGQLARRLVGVDAELDFDDLRTKTDRSSIGAVFVCINDDAISVALAYEIKRDFPDALVCARVSTRRQGIGKLLPAATAVRPDNRVHFVGFHDAAKDLASREPPTTRTSSP